MCFPFLNQGEKSKQPSKGKKGQAEKLSEPHTQEDTFSLVAEVKELRKIVSEREKQQKESEKLQKQMTEEWKQMKLQLQHVLNTNESKYRVAYIIAIWCLKKCCTFKCQVNEQTENCCMKFTPVK